MESVKRKDPSSSANSRQVVVKHWDWEVEVDFQKKTLRCAATLQIRTLCEGVRNLVRVACQKIILRSVSDVISQPFVNIEINIFYFRFWTVWV